VTEVAGRGVGLDTVKRRAESVGGSMSIASEPGRGTAVTLTLPLSLTLLDALLVERAGSVFGIPLADVAEVAAATGAMTLGGRQSLAVRGEPIPAGDVAAVLGGRPPALEARAAAVVVASPDGRAALLCDRVLGEEELVVKGLGPLLAGAPGYVGGAVLGDGRVALVLDSAFLVTRTGRVTAPRTESREERPPPKVLVVDDQFTVRELQRSILEAAGYRVATAGDALEARERLSQDGEVELVVTDIEMPGMDGLELLARIREDPAHSSLPVVIVSSRGSPEDERRGLEAGADAYLGKERFDQDALLATVARLVGR
jgi:two-component system chemotaxis sensor kinase CheA